MKLHSLLWWTFMWDFGMLTPTKFNWKMSVSFLGHKRHLDLLAQFRNLTKDLNPSKLYQKSMDGPNTNLKFLNEYSNKFVETTLHSLINIPILSGWGFARREDYAIVTGSSIYSFNFCATRYNLLQTIYYFANLLDISCIITSRYIAKNHCMDRLVNNMTFPLDKQQIVRWWQTILWQKVTNHDTLKNQTLHFYFFVYRFF